MIGRFMPSLSLRMPTAVAAGALLLIAPAAHAAAPDRKAPTTPTSLTVTGKTAYSVSLGWGASTDNSGSLSYRVVNATSGLYAVVPGTQTTFTWDTNLTPQLTYSFTVSAFDAAGNTSKASNTVSATLPRDTAPPLAPLVSLTDTGPTHLSLSWKAQDEDSTLVWLLFLNGTVLYSGSQTSMIVTPLTPETAYTFTVQGRDSGGNWSPVSAPLVATTDPSDSSDTTPPTTPALWGGPIDGCEVMLFWSASSDNVTPPEFIRYDMFVNGFHAQSTTLGRLQAIEYGIVNGPNTFEIVAVDEAGNKAAPATATFEMFGCITPQ